MLPNLPENCPICGKKMEKGYMAWGQSNIFWSKEKVKRTLRGKETIIARPFASWGVYDIEAYRCPNCKIVLFSYEKEQTQK